MPCGPGRRTLDPTFTLARYRLAWALTAERRYDEAAAVLDNGQAADDGYRLAMREYVYANARWRVEARGALERLIRLARADHALAINVAAA